MKNTILILFAVLLFACRKDETASVFGEWQTVSAFGYKWEYTIQEGGMFCRALPEYFPGSNFCFSYQIRRDTMFINTPDSDVWVYKLEADNILSINSLKGNNGKGETIILRRK